jgi:DNA-binding beta-propeller fold protein YncE
LKPPSTFKCPTHPTEEQNLYCQTCEQLVCIYCGFRNHPLPQHKCFFIAEQDGKEAIGNYKTEIQQLFSQNKANQAKMKEALTQVRELQQRAKMRAAEAAQQVNQTFDSLITRLQERRNMLLEKIDQAKAAKMEALSGQEKDLSEKLAKVDSTWTAWQTRMNYEDDREFLTLRKTTKSELKEMIDQIVLPDLQLPQEDDWIDCNIEGSDDLQKRIEKFGTINVHGEHCAMEEAEEKKEVIGEALKEKEVVSKGKQLKRKNSGDDSVEVEERNVVVEEKHANSNVGAKPPTTSNDQLVVEDRNNLEQPSWFISRDPQVIFCFGRLGTNTGEFSNPCGVVVNKQGNILVAEYGNNRIQEFDRRGNFVRIWWVSQGLQRLCCMALDNQGNVVASDTENHRIQVFDGEGNILRMWGTYGSGQAQFKNPWGVAVDREGNIVVADYGNNRIQVFDEKGNFLRMWGSQGTGQAQFKEPACVVVDREGSVIIADYGNSRIQVFNRGGTFLRMWGREGAGKAQFKQPWGLAVDGKGNILVADSDNHRIQVFDGEGNFLRMWGSRGTGPAQFLNPRSVTVDAEGNVIVAEYWNHRVQVLGYREAG